MSEQKPNENDLAIPEGTEIQVASQPGQTIEQQTTDRIKELEAQFKIANRMVQLALSRTRPGDWVDIAGKPYLQATGAKKMLAPFGLKIENVRYEMETKESGRHGQPEVIYTCSLTISSKRLAPYDEIGTASSADDFFSKRKDKEGNYYWLSVAEVDLTDVKKKSQANALGRAIKAVLGLDNLTWDDLGAFGITRAEKGYDFNKGGQGGGTTTDEGAAKKRQEIRDMLLEVLNNDTAAAQEALKQLTMFNGRGLSSVDQITDKAVNVNHQKVKAFCAAFRADPDMAKAIKAGIAAVSK